MRWFIGLIKLRRRGICIGMAGIKFGPSSEDDAKTIPRVQQTFLRLRFDWVSLLHGPSTRLRVGARPPSLYQRQDQWPTPSWYVKIHVRTEPPVGVDWSLHAILWSLRHRPINYAFDHYVCMKKPLLGDSKLTNFIKMFHVFDQIFILFVFGHV